MKRRPHDFHHVCAIALLLLVATGIVAIAYLRAPSSFIGGPRHPPPEVGWHRPTTFPPAQAVEHLPIE